MIKRKSQILYAWFITWDLIVTTAAWVGAYNVRFQSGWIPLWKTPQEAYLCWRTLPLVILLAIISYRFTGQYTIHRLRRFREEMVCVVKGTGLLSLLVMATIFYLHDPYESRITMLLFSLLSGTGVLICRRLSWIAIRHLRSQGYNQSRSLIVGTGRGPAKPPARSDAPAGWGSRTSVSSRICPTAGRATSTSSALPPSCLRLSPATRSSMSSSPCR
jgi:hypothetical protein